MYWSLIGLFYWNPYSQAIRSSVPILHLIESLQPGIIDWSLVDSTASHDTDTMMRNAQYAVTMARMIGAPVYALSEDIVEGRHKMVMTVFASLMLVDQADQEQYPPSSLTPREL